MHRFHPRICLLGLLLLFACRTGETIDPEVCRDGTCTYTFAADSQIALAMQDSLIVGADIGAGDRLVFRYFYVKDDKPQIADDEYAELVLWEVAPTGDRFELTGADLSEALVLFHAICFCAERQYLSPQAGGSIRGTRLDAQTWRITADLHFLSDSHDRHLSFVQDFVEE
ncbi:MAG: hypothetical protein OHK0039_28830 [Bacteroidia bacterium]